MALTQIAFLALLLATLTAAFARGGGPERSAGAMMLAAALISPLVQNRALLGVEIGIMAADIALLAGLLWLALATNRSWPSWAAAFQLLSVLTHVARGISNPVNGNVYGDLLVLWSYPTLGALLWGTLMDRPRTGAAPIPPTRPDLREVTQQRQPTGNDDLALMIRLLRDNGVGEAAPRLASKLLAHAGSFAAAVATPPATLHRLGMDERVAEACAFARGITRTTLRRTLETRPDLGNNAATIDYLHNELAHLREEQFRVLYLNARHRLIADEVHGQGSVTEAPVFPREVVRRAIELGAVHLILAHNHPSGDPTPSRPDITTTRAIIEAARTIGVSVVDHIIISPSGHTSMRSVGLI